MYWEVSLDLTSITELALILWLPNLFELLRKTKGAMCHGNSRNTASQASKNWRIAQRVSVQMVILDAQSSSGWMTRLLGFGGKAGVFSTHTDYHTWSEFR